MLDHHKIMEEAIDRCLCEMYEKAQPRANWHDYIEMAKRGEIGKDERIFERHYLCDNQFTYILNKYKKAYGFEEQWKSNIDFLIENLKEGGRKIVYKPLIEGGDPARTSEEMLPIKDIIGEENANKLFEYIENIKDFYHFDRKEEIFNFNIALGCSPTSNAETVKEFWASKGVDIEIDETELSEDDYWEIDMYGHILEEDDDLDESKE